MSNALYATPSEVLYMFAGWLTSRNQAIKIGRHQDAAVVVDLVTNFCEEQDLPEPRDGFAMRFKPMHTSEPFSSERLWGILDNYFGDTLSIAVGAGASGGTVFWGRRSPDEWILDFDLDVDPDYIIESMRRSCLI